MTIFREQILERERRLLVLSALVLSTMLSLGLLAARWALAGHLAFRFLIWNLFLAWIPFGLACMVYYAHLSRSRHRVWMVVLGILWLLFFPNAPYLWTDLVHLRRGQPGTAWWCDLVMALSFGWNGMLLGLLSLYLIQRVVLERVGRWWGWATVAVALGLGSFGISLGRFDRFNSWDVFSKPVELLINTADELLHPISHPLPFAIAGLFFAFLALAYLTLLALMGLERSDILRSRPPKREWLPSTR